MNGIPEKWNGPTDARNTRRPGGTPGIVRSPAMILADARGPAAGRPRWLAPEPPPARPARKGKPKPAVPDTTRMFLSIRDQVYRVARLKVQDQSVTHAYRLRRADGKATHDVHVDAHGAG